MDEKASGMKDEYDFSEAEQGRFYRPIEEIDIPIYLDKEEPHAKVGSCFITRRKLTRKRSL
uniref:Uncharacterized protein n=1 Tax=Candidatus Kentrum sp. DK TaxID=2126562 RepID=A0A450SIG3_9GAMM|nr:MAG: hypothetical protein BECKDK2373B_GA0170837_104112 [Candidatus Kentron sp. DK]VFJ68571.1 MAG: hypothetical protein BECKDK2373C_GA0170839_11875 [Candidatus Kentron sp. DK]